MTGHEEAPPRPPAWSVCDACGAVAPNRDLHQQWHDDIEGRLAVLEQPTPPASSSSEEVV